MSSLNKIIVFGATGNTGLCCLQAALDLGYTVTAFVRDPSKLPSELCGRVEVFEGDVLDGHKVDEAVLGHDAVVVALGTRNDLAPTTVLSEGTQNIISAMQRSAIKKISVCLSAFLLMDKSQIPERYHPVTEDHKRMLEYIKASNLEWVAVMPPHISDEPGCGDYTVSHGKVPGRSISKHYLGHFLVSALTDDTHRKEVCGLCDKQKEGAVGQCAHSQ